MSTKKGRAKSLEEAKQYPYYDENEDLSYSEIPEGKVLRPIERYSEEVVVYPKSGPGSKSTTMGSAYDELDDKTENNFLHSLERDAEDNRIRKANHWEGVMNVTSPTRYIGAMFDAVQGKRSFGEALWYGNSGVVPELFAENHPYWTFGINTLTDMALGYGSGKLYNYAKTPIIKSGTETPIITYKPFSLNVEKHSFIHPSEMHVRNNTPGVVKSNFKGIDSDGLYVYTLPRMWFPKNESFTKFTFNEAIKPMLKKGYHKVTHPNLQGIALQNKKWSISDFGNYGEGQVGWTWWGSPKIGDAAWETIPEFLIAMEKKGGKINGNK